MSLYDQNLVFFTTPNGQPITAGGTVISEGTYDMLQGLMLPTTGGTYPLDTDNAIIGRLRQAPLAPPRTKFWGEDLGLGRGPGTPTIDVYMGGVDPANPPAGGTSIQVVLAGAVDNGGGTVASLIFTPYIETGAIPLTQLVANIAEGWNQVAEFDLPRRPIGTPLPRFLQLQYIAVGAFTGLNLMGYIGLGDTSAEDTLGQYPSNY